MQLEKFALIDRVESLSADRSAICCLSTLPLQSPVFEGHFPGFPIMPGVMMIETMAQAAGYLLLARNGVTAMPVLAAVDGVRFRALARPGEALTAEARMRHDGSGYAVLETRLACGERALTEAVLRLRILPFFNEEMRSHILALASRHGLTAGAPPVREIQPA